MDNEFRVAIISPPDRNFLTAEIMLDNQQVAELNQEEEFLSLEIYPRGDGESWRLPYQAFLNSLIEAKKRLTD